MEKSPPKLSTLLSTPDPHYIPGYAGYCPQLKYHMGKPYAQLTAKLLTSPEISHSPRLVLSSGPAWDAVAREEIWRKGGKTPQKMIPGYTGFIPRRQNYFSKTYAQTCREAISEFDADQETRIRADTATVPDQAFPDIKPRVLNTPLVAISKEPFTCKSVNSWKPPGSPYSMDDNDPHKYFISGFTGFVPRTRFLNGSSYSLTTNKALIQFGKQIKGSHTAHDLEEDSADNLPIIYPTHRGMLPHYTGHVPGYKFRHGKTFGKLTSNSVPLSGTRRRIDREG